MPRRPKVRLPIAAQKMKKKNTDKAATTKSSEATNRPTQSSPTPHVTTARPHRHVDQVNRPPLPVGPATSNWR